MSQETIPDDRLEELRANYEYLSQQPTAARDDGRRKSDAQHAALFAELQKHRERVCSECEGRTFIQNPNARWYRDHDGCDGTNDPEEIECPQCNGVGYEPPPRRKDEPRMPTIYDTREEPF